MKSESHDFFLKNPNTNEKEDENIGPSRKLSNVSFDELEPSFINLNQVSQKLFPNKIFMLFDLVHKSMLITIIQIPKDEPKFLSARFETPISTNMHSGASPSSGHAALPSFLNRLESSWQASQLDDNDQNFGISRMLSTENNLEGMERRPSFTIDHNTNQKITFNRPTPIFNGKTRLIQSFS